MTRGTYERTPEIREKIRLTKIGNKNAFGKHYTLTPETRAKQSIAKTRELHPNWKDGSSLIPYGSEFNNALKESIRQRDNYTCQKGGILQFELIGRFKKLQIHHVDYCKKHNDPNNLISLCRSCHSITNFSKSDWERYFNNKLSNWNVKLF